MIHSVQWENYPYESLIKIIWLRNFLPFAYCSTIIQISDARPLIWTNSVLFLLRRIRHYFDSSFFFGEQASMKYAPSWDERVTLFHPPPLTTLHIVASCIPRAAEINYIRDKISFFVAENIPKIFLTGAAKNFSICLLLSQ